MTTERFFRAVQKGRVRAIIPLTHIVLLYLIYKSKFLIFDRDDGRHGTVSGKRRLDLRVIEPWKNTCIREAAEETGLKIRKGDIQSARHSFFGISPTGKFLYGQSFYIILNCKSLQRSTIKLNGELNSYKLLKSSEAIEALELNGFPEQLEGLKRVANIIGEQIK